MVTTDSVPWSQVAAKGAGLKVLTRARHADSNTNLSTEILYEHPDFQDQQLARKAATIVRQALTPDSVLFSFPPSTFAHRTEAYDAISKEIGPLADVRPLSLYSTNARGDLLIEAKFQSPEDTTKAIQSGIIVDDVLYKASPSVQGVEKPLVRVQLNLLRMATGEELKDGLLSSLRYYGKVYQIRRLLCNGYFEGQLTITLDPSHGYKDAKGQNQYSQPLQRMLYLEKWDVFAPASFKGAQPICYYCRQAGHIRSDCPDLAKRRCFGCGETGHTKRFCKKLLPLEEDHATLETELIDKYIEDTTADQTDAAVPSSPVEDEQEHEISMDEDQPIVEEKTDKARHESDEEMDMTEEDQKTKDKAEKDPSSSILASQWAPYDCATTMKVDSQAEMLNLSKVNDTTKAKSATVKRKILKHSASIHKKPGKPATPLLLKPIVPPLTNKSSSSAHRAQ